MWYVLPHLAAICARLREAMASGATLMIEQSFPAEQKFGREYVDSPECLVERYLRPAGFKLEHQFREILTGETVAILKLRA